MSLLVRFLMAVLMGPGAMNFAAAQSGPIKLGDYSATINGLALSYTVAGKGPVALVPTPGWGPGKNYLSKTLVPLEKQFTMVYLDTRGSGKSEVPKGDATTWDELDADLEGLRMHLGVDKVWLIGHSAAGTQALRYAANHGEHVAGVIAIDAPSDSTHALETDMQQRVMARKDAPWFANAFAALQAPVKNQAEFDASMSRMMPLYFADPSKIQSNGAVFKQVSLSFPAWTRAEKRLTSIDALLPKIQAPTLIVVGDKDFICPPTQATVLHRGIRNSKFLLIENAGHFSWIEQPDLFFEGVNKFLPTLGYVAN